MHVKRYQLLSHVEQISHDAKGIESILEHAVEEDIGVAEEADMSGLAVISDVPKRFLFLRSNISPFTMPIFSLFDFSALKRFAFN